MSIIRNETTDLVYSQLLDNITVQEQSLPEQSDARAWLSNFSKSLREAYHGSKPVPSLSTWVSEHMADVYSLPSTVVSDDMKQTIGTARDNLLTAENGDEITW